MEKKISLSIINIIILLSLNPTSLAYNNYPYDLLGGALVGSCCLIYLLFLILWILIGIWVYKDAERRGKSGALWLIIVILLGWIGIIIWLIIRSPIKEKTVSRQESDRHCPNCDRSIPYDARTCPYCSKKFW
jgi:hypothetical protein